MTCRDASPTGARRNVLARHPFPPKDAQRFVDEGAHVFIMGRRRGELDKAKALIGDGLSTVAGDVTNSADLHKLFATVLAKEGGLDVLVANSALRPTY
jgi:NAD(P)-dependent dehydrogenase (short-subunit alcohol dehydrogenase family)